MLFLQQYSTDTWKQTKYKYWLVVKLISHFSWRTEELNSTSCLACVTDLLAVVGEEKTNKFYSAEYELLVFFRLGHATHPKFAFNIQPA